MNNKKSRCKFRVDPWMESRGLGFSWDTTRDIIVVDRSLYKYLKGT